MPGRNKNSSKKKKQNNSNKKKKNTKKGSAEPPVDGIQTPSTRAVATSTDAIEAEGNAFFKAGKYEEAIAKCLEGIDIDPTVPSNWSIMAACCEKLRRFENMAKAGRICIKADKHFMKGYFQLAVAYKALNDLPNCIKTLDNGLAIQASNPDLKRMKKEVTKLQRGEQHSPPSPSPPITQGDAKSLLTVALQSCRSDRLFEFYNGFFVPIKDTLQAQGKRGVDGPIVSRTFLTNDEDKARSLMIRQLRVTLPVERLPMAYRMMITRELKSLGGLKITNVTQPGSDESFTYTTGFAKVLGGSNNTEILVVDRTKRVRKSWNVVGLLNAHFKRLKEGGAHELPLGPGHTLLGDAGVVWLLQTPENEVEGNLYKATTTLEPTRFYGLTGYDLLLLIPVGKQYDGNINTSNRAYATREEALILSNGRDIEGKFRTFNVSCGHCKKTEFELKARLKCCVKCHDVFYCSTSCQKEDWKIKHKIQCGRRPRSQVSTMTEDEQQKKQELEKNMDLICHDWREAVGMRHGGFIVEAGKGFVKDNSLPGTAPKIVAGKGLVKDDSL